MISYPDISPIAFHLFGWPVHWYGLMYGLAFICAIVAGQRAQKMPSFADLRHVVPGDLVSYAAIGVLAGGRLGYVIFYQPLFYLSNPLHVFYLWDGGMSFHGGLLGVIVILILFARSSKVPFWRIADFAALMTPPGLGLGRIGNFINGELPGRPASPDLPWSIIYDHYDLVPRHPSAIYQALLEGVVLCAVLWLLARRRRPDGALAAYFLGGYGLCRIFSELFREPDAHLGLFAGLSLGQWLSAPMLIAAALILRYAYKKKASS